MSRERHKKNLVHISAAPVEGHRLQSIQFIRIYVAGSCHVVPCSHPEARSTSRRMSLVPLSQASPPLRRHRRDEPTRHRRDDRRNRRNRRNRRLRQPA